MSDEPTIVIEVANGIVSPVTAKHGTVLLIRDTDHKEERLYRMAQTEWVLLAERSLLSGHREVLLAMLDSIDGPKKKGKK